MQNLWTNIDECLKAFPSEVLDCSTGWTTLVQGNLVDALSRLAHSQSPDWNAVEQWANYAKNLSEAQGTAFEQIIRCAKLVSLANAQPQNWVEEVYSLLGLPQDTDTLQMTAQEWTQNREELLRRWVHSAQWDDSLFCRHTAWDVVCSLLGSPRTTTHAQTFTVLLVVNGQGRVCQLKVERIDSGSGAFYPDPRWMVLTPRDNDFRSAEKNALQWAQEVVGLLPTDCKYDVRWSILEWGSPLPVREKLTGASAGLAFALALCKLGAQIGGNNQSPAQRALSERLRKLTLEGATASAQIVKENEEWKLLPITNEYAKIVEAFTTVKVIPRIRYVLMAEGQQGLDGLSPTSCENTSDTQFKEQRILLSSTPEKAIECLKRFSDDWASIRDKIVNQQDLLRQYEEYIPRPGLEGRLRKKLEDLIDKQNGGYVLLEAPPGFGKTALLVNELRQRGFRCAYHLLRREQEWDNVRLMRQSLILQLSWLYGFQMGIPSEEAELVLAFNNALREASERAGDDPVILFIDGLDEAFGGAGDYRDKKLTDYFPQSMPPNVFFFITSRNNDPQQQFQNCLAEIITDEGAKQYIPDILEYLKAENERRTLNLGDDFLKTLADKSEGCFLAAKFYLQQRNDEDNDQFRKRLEEWQQQPSEIYQGYQGVFDYHWNPIQSAVNSDTPPFSYELTQLREFMGLIALAKDRVNMLMLYKLVDTRDNGKPVLRLCKLENERLDLEYVRKFAAACRELFVHFDPIANRHYLRFYHTFFQEKIKEEVKEVKDDVLKVFARFCDRWSETGFQFKEYALRFGVLHHLDRNDGQGACGLLFSDGFARERLNLKTAQEDGMLALITQTQSIVDVLDVDEQKWTEHLVPGLVKWLKDDNSRVRLLALHVCDSLVYELSQLPNFLEQAGKVLAQRIAAKNLVEVEKEWAFRVCVGLLSEAKRHGSSQVDTFATGLAETAAQPLIDSFNSNNAALRLWALRLAAALGKKLNQDNQYMNGGVAELFELLQSGDAEIRSAAARALSSLGDALADLSITKPTLLHLMDRKNPMQVRWSVMVVMSGIGAKLKKNRRFIKKVKPLMKRAQEDADFWQQDIVREQFMNSLEI